MSDTLLKEVQHLFCYFKFKLIFLWLFLFVLFVSTRFTMLLMVDVPFLLQGRLNITACKSFWMVLLFCTVPRISIITYQVLYILMQQIILILECYWPGSPICNLMSLLPFQSFIVVFPKPTILWRITHWIWRCISTVPSITVPLTAPKMFPLGVFLTHVYRNFRLHRFITCFATEQN